MRTRVRQIALLSSLVPAAAFSRAPSPRPFVQVHDGQFFIGAKPYHYLGVNLWFAMHLGAANRPRLVRELDRLQQLGVTNIRLMAASEGPASSPSRVSPAVQNAPGEYDETLLTGLDAVLAEMAKRDMRGVLVLNNFFQWSGGMAQYVNWATGDPIPYPEHHGHTWDEFQNYSARFYVTDKAQTQFERYVAALIARRNTITGVAYRDDPTIMAWQISNEPRGFAYSDAYVTWVDRIGAFIRNRAPHQLISLGGEGKLDRHTPGTGTQFERVSRSPFLDYLTIHLWIENWGWYDPAHADSTWDVALGRSMSYLADHVAIAQAIHKPLVLEEFGVSRDHRAYDPAAPVTHRDHFFEAVLEALSYLASEPTVVAGGNVWSWSGEARPVTPGGSWHAGDPLTGDPPHERQGWYSIYAGDTSTTSIIRHYARQMDGIGRLQLSRLITDGMVMQRDARVPVWGWAAPGDEVVVTFDDHSYSTRVESSGSWSVALPPMSAGGPHQMTIADGEDKVAVHEILVGDVWVCSGQSNMEWVVADARHGAQDVAAANDPEIRHFKVQKSWATHPDSEIDGGPWEQADPEHVGHFTAVGYFFARELRKTVHVPIGLLHTSWGGSRIEPWMSAASLHLDAAGIAAVLRDDSVHQARVLDSLRTRIGDLPTYDAGLVDGKALWADPALDDSRWTMIDVPKLWPQAGYDGFDGVAWYRTAFTLSDAQSPSPVQLSLGTIDNSDITWVNGVEVGRMENAWNRARVYTVPPTALRAGKNVLAIRVQNYSGGGGIYGDPSLVFVNASGASSAHISLAGSWRFKVGEYIARDDTHKNQVPTLLYNKMIHPILPYPIKGVLWYQGESNANNAEDARNYRALFSTLITSWRDAWHEPSMPFLWVQLANFMAADSAPSESNWALLRESQHAALSLPNTGEAVIIDLGDANDIHPRNKQDVGVRLALAARHISGPTFRGAHVQHGRMVIEFDHTGDGLITKGQLRGVKGFAIAGADRHFVWAEAAIKGDRVIVWSEAVRDPKAVRYAWGDNPAAANLYNRDGLPAAPFRTDQW
ncbi:MAG TPA: sialate O-acetylesterase [Gemmatimonadaceae bacterium]|nr:sialate O-acetylesterase [Gemmatimonadaceae bacterium]